jgi:hypothetical protein
MAAAYIPAPGQFAGDNPWGVQMVKVTCGGSGETADVKLAAIESGSADQVVSLFEYGAGGLMVLDIKTRVKEAFLATAAMTIGDTASADGFYTSAMIGPTTANADGVFKSMVQDTSSSRGGGWYTSTSGVIELVFSPADSTDAVSGIIEVQLWYAYGVQ